MQGGARVIPSDRRPWMQDAVCRGIDTALFFPERGDPGDQAKAVCATCSVAEPCLAMAFAERLHIGIYGGTSGLQRNRRFTQKQIQILLNQYSPYRCVGCGCGLRAHTRHLLCNKCRVERGMRPSGYLPKKHLSKSA